MEKTQRGNKLKVEWDRRYESSHKVARRIAEVIVDNPYIKMIEISGMKTQIKIPVRIWSNDKDVERSGFEMWIWPQLVS